MSLKKILALLTLMTVSLSAYTLTDREQRIADRLEPIGSVCMTGEDCAAGSGSADSGPKDPETVYNTFCTGCHSTGIPGIPALADVDAWAPRIEKGIETLYSNAINGINGMPPNGTCASCSEEDIKATVDYIISKSQ